MSARPVAKVALEYTVKSECTLSEMGEAHLLDLYRAIRGGLVDEENAPAGFLNAIRKLYDDASDSLILHTLMGEIIAGIVIDELPTFFPGAKYGFQFKPLKVQYREIPETLEPPATALPLIVVPGGNAIH